MGSEMCIRDSAYVHAYSMFGLSVNVGKTQVLSQSSLPVPQVPLPDIFIDGKPLTRVERFKYLGSVLTSSPNCNADIVSRISSAAAAYHRLRKRVFSSHKLSLTTKSLVYRAVVLPTLLYACESWTLDCQVADVC